MEKIVKNLADVKVIKPGTEVVILAEGQLKVATITATKILPIEGEGWDVEYTLSDGTTADNAAKFLVSEENLENGNSIKRVACKKVDILDSKILHTDSNIKATFFGVGSIELIKGGEPITLSNFEIICDKCSTFRLARYDDFGMLYVGKELYEDYNTPTSNGKTPIELLTLTPEQQAAWNRLKSAFLECEKTGAHLYYHREWDGLYAVNGKNIAEADPCYHDEEGYVSAEALEASQSISMSVYDYCETMYFKFK